MITPIVFRDEGFTLDVSRSGVARTDILNLSDRLTAAHGEMARLEGGAVKNKDENRKVTHFTDRIEYGKTELFGDVDRFFSDVAAGRITGSTGELFEYVILNGIGGSALGPQLAQMALNGPYWNELTSAQRNGYPRLYFLDNTDPAGLADLLQVIRLERTLVVSISKSGSTQETKNNLVALESIYKSNRLNFPEHAAAVTMNGSELDHYASTNSWIKRWHMAESIGGRTSVTAVVGHVPAAAGNIDFAGLLNGALTMDEWTRQPDVFRNPAYLLAAVWYLLGNGRGDKNMVIIPYSDRMILLSRYLQQLVMESLGKELDRDGRVVHQGLTVFGNKGGTDAHAFIQQLNDGRNDFFITFIEVLKDAELFVIDNNLTVGDYLHNFMAGLANALHSKNRGVLTITLEALNARTLGMVISLYERAVAVYAELININAFHQPGVQAYKRASTELDALHQSLQRFIAGNSRFAGSAADIAERMDKPGDAREIEGILSKFAVNSRIIANKTITRQATDDGWIFSVST